MSDSPQQLADSPKAFLNVAPVALGIALAGLSLGILFGGRQSDFTAAALGAETMCVLAEVNGQPIHAASRADLFRCLDAYRQRGAKPAALWLGNSQLHGINQYKPGQTSAPGLLHRQLAPLGLDLLAVSPPNAGAEEHEFLFRYLRDKLNLRMVILAVCFDDMRNEGIREDLQLLLSSDAKASSTVATEDLAGVAQTTQEITERWLNEFLNRHCRLWRLRPEARGQLFLGLYKLRNTLLGIRAQTRRRMLRPCYERNLRAIESLLAECKKSGIRAIVYVVPIRHDMDIPYDPSEYADFRRNLADLAGRYAQSFLDLDGIVPGPLWGRKDSTNVGGQAELDFMHFQAGGHELLAEALAEYIRATSQKERPE